MRYEWYQYHANMHTGTINMRIVTAKFHTAMANMNIATANIKIYIYDDMTAYICAAGMNIQWAKMITDFPPELLV